MLQIAKAPALGSDNLGFVFEVPSQKWQNRNGMWMRCFCC